MPTQTFSSIEILESRIAPASIAGGVLKYTDLDGDLVQITFSAGSSLTLGNFTFDTAGAKQQLQLIDIHGLSALGGGDITEKVTHVAGGDGLAPIGYLNAAGVDLGKVKLFGDLGRIDAGTDAASNVAIKSLEVKSMGLFGTATQASGGTLNSAIKGSIGSVTVATDLRGAQLILTDSTAAANAKIGPVSIGGVVTSSAKIQVAGSLGQVTVSDSVSGGTFIATGAIGGVSIAHDFSNGQVQGGSIGTVKVGGSLTSTTITGTTGITSATIGMDINGGTLTSSGKIGAVKVGGSISSGGKISAAGDLVSVSVGGFLQNSSTIESTGGVLLSAKIGGSVVNSTITGKNGIGSLTVKGDLDGGTVTSAGGGITTVMIGGGAEGADVTAMSKIGSFKIKGAFLNGEITSSAGDLATLQVGGDLSASSVSAVNLGSITVGHDAGGSSLTATTGNIISAKIGGSVNGSILKSASGNLGPVTIGRDLNGAIVSGKSIAALKIGGSIEGSSIQSTAGDITSMKIGGSLEGANVAAAAGKIAAITIGRNLNGGSLSGKSIGTVKIASTMVGSNITSDTDLAGVSVGGTVSGSSILAGTTGAPASATIGAVSVGGDWIASSMSAGVKSNGTGYGNANDTVLSLATSSIASIIIKGTVAGTAASGDHFGFDARSIGSFKLGGFTLPLAAAPSSTALSQVTGDVAVVLFA